MRRLALVAATVTLGFCVATPAASADLGATVCSLSGWISGVVGKVCNVARHAGGVINAGKKLAGGHIGGAIGALTGGGAGNAVARTAGLAAVAAAVVAGAQYALAQTGRLISSTETPNLRTTWFSAYYWRMAAVAALLTLPFLCAAAIQAILRSDLSLLARSAFGYLPLGLLAVGIAAPLTGLLLAGSDEMSAIVSAAAGHADTGILDRAGLVGLIAGGSRGLFLAFFVALFTVAAAVTLWLELLIRQAAVYVIVLMLPLFFAAMVWPARRIWAARAVELLVALILSKFAIVAVLSLGGAALGHTLIPGFQALFAGTTLVLLAAFSPWAMLRLLPLHELAGAAVGGLGPAVAQPPAIADDRAHPAADAGEDAAADLPGRLLAMMQHDPAGSADGAGDAGADAVVRASAPPAEVPDTDPVDPETRAPDTGRSASPSDGGDAAVATVGTEAPPEDAFGPTVRHGPRPKLFDPRSRLRTFDLGDGLRSDEPLLDDQVLGPAPDPGAEPERAHKPVPEPKPERAHEPEPAPEPDLGPPPLPRPEPGDDER